MSEPQPAPNQPNFCNRHHKVLAKLFIDGSLFIPTLFQLLLVQRTDKDQHETLPPILMGILIVSLILQSLVIIMYISLRIMPNTSDRNNLKLLITQIIFILTILHILASVLMEGFLDPRLYRK